MLSRPTPKSAKIGVLGLIVVIALGAVLLPMAAGAKESRRKQSEITSKQGSEAESVVDATLYQGRHGSVSGTVRIHGTEVPASGVVVKTISKWFETVQALTDEQGNYTLAGIRPEAVFHISAEDEQRELYVMKTDMPAVVLWPYSR